MISGLVSITLTFGILMATGQQKERDEAKRSPSENLKQEAVFNMNSENIVEYETEIEFNLASVASVNDNYKGLLVDTSLEKIFHAQPGMRIEKDIKLMSEFAEASDLHITVKPVDFEINRTDCSDRQPKVGETTDNSAAEWISLGMISSKDELENGEAKVKVIIDVPEDAEEKTYWVMISFEHTTEDGLGAAMGSLFFVTVGSNELSEYCLTDESRDNL